MACILILGEFVLFANIEKMESSYMKIWISKFSWKAKQNKIKYQEIKENAGPAFLASVIA